MSRYLERCPGCGARRILFVARDGLCLDCVDDDQLDLKPERNPRPTFRKKIPNSSNQWAKELPPCPYGGKGSFRSPAKAKAAIRDHAPGTQPLYTYQCPNCSLWHITSWPQKARRAS